MDPFSKIRLSSRFLHRWKSSVHLFRVYPHETIVIATTGLGLCPFCGSTDIRILYFRWRHAGFHGERGSPLVLLITCLRWISQIHLLGDTPADWRPGGQYGRLIFFPLTFPSRGRMLALTLNTGSIGESKEAQGTPSRPISFIFIPFLTKSCQIIGFALISGIGHPNVWEILDPPLGSVCSSTSKMNLSHSSARDRNLSRSTESWSGPWTLLEVNRPRELCVVAFVCKDTVSVLLFEVRLYGRRAGCLTHLLFWKQEENNCNLSGAKVEYQKWWWRKMGPFGSHSIKPNAKVMVLTDGLPG